MNFIERLTGLAPDGGQGWFEALILVTLLGLIAWRSHRKLTRPR